MKFLPIYLFLLICTPAIVHAQFNFKPVDLSATDIVFAPKQKKLYCTVNSNFKKYGNSVCRIDPYSGAIEASFWIGSEPSKIVLSTDEKYAWVSFDGTSRVRKLNLLNGQIESDLILSNEDIRQFPYYVNDMLVLPEHSGTIVIARKSLDRNNNGGVIVSDNTVPRRISTFDGRNIGSNSLFTYKDSSLIWGAGYNAYSQGFSWFKMSVDSSGISNTTVYENIGFGVNFQFCPKDSLFYTSNGNVYDVRTGTPVKKGYFQSFGYLFADVASDTLYDYSYDYPSIQLIVTVINRKTGARGNGNYLPVISSALKAVSWGGAGQIAIVSSRNIVIFNPCTPLVTMPTIAEGTAVKGCKSGQIKLTASENADKYYWSTGDTSKSIAITANGSYSVGIADATGCVNYSKATDVKLIENPSPPSIYIENSFLSFCSGGSAKLLASSITPNVTYEWSNGKKTPTIDITTSGAYDCTAITLEGCRATTPYQFYFNDHTIIDKPKIKIIGDTVFCADANTVLVGPPGFTTYKWSTGENTQTISVLPNSTEFYSVNVINEYGCESTTYPVFIAVNRNLFKPQVTVNGKKLTSEFVSGNQWFFNGEPIVGANQQTFTTSQKGFYTLQVTISGCSTFFSDLVNILTPTTDIFDNDLMQLFPNPTFDNVKVTTRQFNSRIIVSDVSGNIMSEQNIESGENNIPLNNLPSGIYFFKLVTKSSEILSLKKIIKL